MNKKALLQSFREGWEKLKPMTWKQRVDHIWTYYKAVVLFASVAIILPVAVIISIATKKDVAFSGMAINVDMRKVGVTYLTDDWFDRIGGDPKKEIAELYANALDPEQGELESTYGVAMSTIARAESKTLDYLLVDQVALEFYIVQEIYMDLRCVFTEEELAAFGAENVIKITPEDDPTVMIPIAINITEMAFAKDCLEADGTIYFSFVGQEEKASLYREFWAYLLAWEETDYHKELASK